MINVFKVSICFVFILTNCQYEKQNNVPDIINLSVELEAMFDNDQYYRKQFSNELAECGQNSDKLGEFYQLSEETDSINSIKVDAILSEYGWPNQDIISRKANEAIFLVIQHSSLNYQKKLLPLVNQAYFEGKIGGQQMALLKDRISVRESGYQIYGSQIENISTNEYSLYPLRYPNKIDSLRQIMGLEPLQDYLSRWNLIWDIKKHKERTAEIEAEKEL